MKQLFYFSITFIVLTTIIACEPETQSPKLTKERQLQDTASFGMTITIDTNWADTIYYHY